MTDARIITREELLEFVQAERHRAFGVPGEAGTGIERRAAQAPHAPREPAPLYGHWRAHDDRRMTWPRTQHLPP